MNANAALRKVILSAADNPQVRRVVSKHGMRLGGSRFVAGETMDDAVRALRELNERGLHANTTLLGEAVRDEAEARTVSDEYVVLAERLASEQLRANVALKLTHLGLELGEDVAFEVEDSEEMTRRLATAGAEVIAEPTRTPWNSLNARLAAPAGLQLTLFQELG